MENKKMETNNIIALCHIIDDYNEFEKGLISTLAYKWNRNFIFQLIDISEKKFVIGARKAKEFYNENKQIIDTINKYSSFSSFICDNYDCYGNPNESITYFCKYISFHKEKIDKILDVLSKLKKLGFWRIEFNEDLDFTKETYSINPLFRNNYRITYVPNIKVIPNYIDLINYITTNSNYKMVLDIIGEKFSNYNRKIILNSLLFDSRCFPTHIGRKNIFEYILKLKKEQLKQSSMIRNSVDLRVSIDDLEKQLNSTNNIINNLDEVKNKDEYISILLSIKEYLEKLKTLSFEYDSRILEEEALLTREILDNEKDLYLKRRHFSSMDIDSKKKSS